MLQTYIAGVFIEADGANIALDEGWVKIGETDDMPAYLKAGNFIVALCPSKPVPPSELE